jgi:O-Antigen ligase/Tetratricopeptide repeat
VTSSGVRAASALALGAALAAVAFGAAGGTARTRTITVEVIVVLAGGALVALAVYRGRARGPGGLVLLLFAALAVLTALSVLWSVVPDLTYVEAGRTLAYLVLFAVGVAIARLAPRSPDVALAGVLVAGVAVVAYALASRVWPASLAENEFSNRLGAPFQYWNAVGTTAAMCVPALLWLGARRTGHVLARSLAYPAMGACILTILLTQSRGALAAAVLAAIAWFAIVPLRLRSLPVLLAPALCAGLVGAWALSRDPFTKILQPLAAKESVAGEFGLLVLLMSAVLLLAGLLVNAGLARAPVPMRARRATGLVALTVALAVPLVGITSVAFSQGGLGGTIGDRVDELVSETDGYTDQGANRLTATSSTRGKYWREAGRVFDDRPLLGVGAGAFEVARLRHRTDAAVTRHAHGFGVQTLADLGLVGAALVVALLIAWLAAVAQATLLYPRRRRRDGAAPPARRDWTDERTALVALALVAITFGLQSAIDWTWFVPGPAAMALVAGGYVAGRGPLGARPAPEPTGAPPVLAAAAVMLAALLVAWAVWQPEASDRSVDEALRLAGEGRYDEALAKAADAADADPLSPTPLFARADVQFAFGRRADADQTLEQAVLSFPGDPRTWLRLTRVKLSLGHPREADQVVRGALYLDPYSTEARTLYISARSGIRRARP